MLHQDSQSKVVERVIRKYDPTGNPGLPITIRIEEKKNPDGSTSILSNSYETDLNGNKQLFERSSTLKRGGAAKESSTTVERATLNGGLQTVERDTDGGAQDRRQCEGGIDLVPAGCERQLHALRPDGEATSKAGAVETADAANYEMGPDGKLVLASRSIDHVVTKPDGSKVVDSDVYSRFNAGRASDVNASEPRLQQQVHKELTPGPGGVTIETTSVRARLANDPSRFGDLQRYRRAPIPAPMRVAARSKTVRRW